MCVYLCMDCCVYVCVYMFMCILYIFLLACCITLLVSDTKCFLEFVFTLIVHSFFILRNQCSFSHLLSCCCTHYILFISCIKFLSFVQLFREFSKCLVVLFNENNLTYRIHLLLFLLLCDFLCLLV